MTADELDRLRRAWVRAVAAHLSPLAVEVTDAARAYYDARQASTTEVRAEHDRRTGATARDGDL